ncbi:hypothetical protein [Alloscardovia omnicolens]|uniref:DUF6900 domain-containing protein n=1 Tax=Alloscardovia omnicolens TaxID=419015 RepID=UPI003A704CF4
MTKKEEKILLTIAAKHNGEMEERQSFETFHSDADDFLEVSIWGLKAMLEEAFDAGKKAAKN